MTSAEDLKRLNAMMPPPFLEPDARAAIDQMVNLIAVRCANVIDARAQTGADGRPNFTTMDAFTASGVAGDLAALRAMRRQFGPLKHDAPEWLDELIFSDLGAVMTFYVNSQSDAISGPPAMSRVQIGPTEMKIDDLIFEIPDRWDSSTIWAAAFFVRIMRWNADKNAQRALADV